MTDIKPYLEPVSAENPCGTDISYDQAFLNLETLVKGKEETQFSEAEDPNWKDVRSAALGLIQQSKNLRLGLVLTLALLETEGLEGYRNGILLLKTWIEKYWESLYPVLDPEDNNDPIQRVNLLQSLSSRGATQEKFLERLCQTPLAESPTLGRYGLKALDTGTARKEIDGALADTDPERLKARYDAAVECYALVKEMDAMLGEKIGRDRAPAFAELMAVLNQITGLIGPHCGGAAVAETAAAPAGAQAGGAAAGGASLSAIGSRADVVRALQAICSYYKSSEPASPIPLLLERAQRLVDKNFMQIIDDLAPSAMPQFDLLAPPKRPESASE